LNVENEASLVNGVILNPLTVTSKFIKF
jgi:hypothetical protein